MTANLQFFIGFFIMAFPLTAMGVAVIASYVGTEEKKKSDHILLLGVMLFLFGFYLVFWSLRPV